MKLLTKSDTKKIPSLYSQDGKGDKAIAYIKFFHCMSSYTFYATEYSPDEERFYGLVCGLDYPEMGYTSLEEMKQLKVRGLGIERDMYFKPITIEECKAKH